MQELNNRECTHGGVKLRLPVVDKLKQWNKKEASIHHDKKFIKILMVDVFSSALLAESTIDSLDVEKLRFIRGMYWEFGIMENQFSLNI